MRAEGFEIPGFTAAIDSAHQLQQDRPDHPIGYLLEEEAIRVVKAMPKWNPGKQNGRPVAVQYNLPIRFTLVE